MQLSKATQRLLPRSLSITKKLKKKVKVSFDIAYANRVFGKFKIVFSIAYVNRVFGCKISYSKSFSKNVY